MAHGRPVLDPPKRPMVKHHCCNCVATFATYAGQQPTVWTRVNGKLYCRSTKCRKAASDAKALYDSKSTTPIAPIAKPRPLYADRLLQQQGLGS